MLAFEGTGKTSRARFFIKKALNAGYELMSPLKNIVGKINFSLNFQVGFNFHSSILKASSI